MHDIKEKKRLDRVHTAGNKIPLRSIIVILAFPGLWLAGIGAILFYSVVQYFKLRRSLISAVPIRKNILYADHIDMPFVMGAIQPKIYLPSSLAEYEQAYVIAHERHYIKRGDPIWRVLAFAALCLHWFNPLVWLAFVLSRRDMEVSCDEAVIQETGGEIRAAYSKSLLRFATGRKRMVGAPLAFGEGDTKERIVHVMKYKKPAIWVTVITALLCVGAITVFAFNAEKEINADNDALLGNEVSSLNHQVEVPDTAPSSSYDMVESDDSNTASAYLAQLQRALLGEISFPLDTSQTRSYSFEGTTTLPELTAEDGADMAPPRFMFIDLDGDGVDEAVYEQGNYRGYYVLRYWEGRVYGYEFNYRGMMDLKQDGTFGESAGAGNNGYGRLCFTGANCEVENFAWLTEGAGYGQYMIDGEQVSRDKYFRYIEEQDAKPNADWREYTPENISALTN